MTQEQEPRPAIRRRAGRGERNRPVLILLNDEGSEQPVAETNATETKATVEEAPSVIATMPRTRRFGGFFSNVEKDEQPKEAEVAQARLARATRGKAASVTSSAAKEETKAEAKEARQPKQTAVGRPVTVPPRRAGGFKMRHIIGIAVYLFGASYIGAAEQSLLGPAGSKPLFVVFNFPVTTATLVFLLTLIVLLVVLARLDLIPRSLTGMSARSTTPQRKTGQAQSQNQETEESVKSPPPTMRPGVKGKDDNLYREYQENRRRSRRR